MTLPVDLIFVRHGQSEANIMQEKLEKGLIDSMPKEFIDRHDSRMRLSPEGVQQAYSAGEWLKDVGLNSFDYYYVSPFVRTRETAVNLKLDGNWRVDDRWRERDWGEYGITTELERETMFPFSRHLRGLNKWYWKPTGGESLATDVRLRFSNILDTLHRHKSANQKVIAVSHGDFIRTAQFVLEKIDPEDWVDFEASKKYKIHNSMILHYSRRNPETNEIIQGDFSYRRAIVPWDQKLSWDNGEWQKIQYKKHSDEDLMKTVEKYPRLF